MIGIIGYALYTVKRIEALEDRINILENKTIKESTTEYPQNFYQRLQQFDNSIGNWLREH